MSDLTAQWYEVCDVNDIPVRGAVRVNHDGRKIAIFKSAKQVIRAIEDSCPHKGGPLSDGIVHGDCVTCPLHNWNINLNSGAVMGDDEGQVNTFRVRVENSSVYLEIADRLLSTG